MEYLRIANSDLLISRIGYGCWPIGGHGYGPVDDAVSIRAIRTALDAGINLFDTADVYGFGHSEQVLGKALGTALKEVVVATKCGVAWDGQGRTYRTCEPNHIIASVENSLRRLNVETIPLYQLHWHDGITPLADIVDALERSREAGKIRYYGYCNMVSEEIGSYGRSFVTSQLRYSLDAPDCDIELAKLQQQQKSVLAYGVLSRGLLSGKYETADSREFGPGDTRRSDPLFTARDQGSVRRLEKLRILAARYGRVPAQIAIRWSLDSPGISSALVGIKTPAQAIENAGAAGWNLTRSDWEWLAQDDASSLAPSDRIETDLSSI